MVTWPSISKRESDKTYCSNFLAKRTCFIKIKNLKQTKED